MRRAAALLLAVGAFFTVGGTASASDYCQTLGQQVQVYPGDPSNLDPDGNGIGCEDQPGPAISQNGDTTVGEFPGQYPNPPKPAGEFEGKIEKPSLAKTGEHSNVVERHPYRSAALGVLAIGCGLALVGLVRRNK